MMNVDVDANEFFFNDPEKKASRHIPKDVYLGRRGSYMLAPGLESFQATMGHGHGHEEDVEDDNDSISALIKKKMAKNAHALDEYKTVNEKIEAQGLICVMHTNGFNIAHQGGINDAGEHTTVVYPLPLTFHYCVVLCCIILSCVVSCFASCLVCCFVLSCLVLSGMVLCCI
jgi:hypothetical protein